MPEISLSLRTSWSSLIVGDLAQRHDRVLVAVAIDHDLAAARDVARALGGVHDQLETVGHLQNAVFDGDARHARPLDFAEAAGYTRRKSKTWRTGNDMGLQLP